MSMFDRRFAEPGTAPGTLTAAEEDFGTRVIMRLVDYGPDQVAECQLTTPEEAFPYLDDRHPTWVEVCGLADVEIIRTLGEHCGIHSLSLEDVLHVGQRPKVEVHPGYLFIVLRLMYLDNGEGLDAEQVSLFIGQDYLLTFRERHTDIFEPVRDRIRRGTGRMRTQGVDYLAYALIDAVVDNFFPLLEIYGERLEDLEDELIDSPSKESLRAVHGTKKNLLMLRRSAWPQREVINALERHETDLIRPETRIYLRDCYDHTIQIMDMVETYRDLASGLTDLYLSSVSNRMNEVMKVLTVLASIFIPLTFVAGVYGMNFDTHSSPWNMPELTWYWGYPAFWGLMVLISGSLLGIFWRKGWL